MNRIKQYVKQYRPQLFMLLALSVVALVSPETALLAAPFVGVVGAVVTVKSSQATNNDAAPPRINPSYTAGSRLHEKVGVAAFANGDSATSQYRFFRVRSSDRLSELFLDCDAPGAGAAFKIGLYDTVLAGGAAVSDALFYPATVNAAALAKANVLTAVTNPNKEKRIWELLALAADPFKEYDVVLTLTVATAAAGSFALTGRHVQN